MPRKSNGANVEKESRRPVARLIDRLSHLSFEDLLDERRRLEKARNGQGIGPDQWYRLHAIRALLTKKSAEARQVLA